MLRRQKRLTRQRDKRPDSSPAETRLEFIVLHVVDDVGAPKKIWNIFAASGAPNSELCNTMMAPRLSEWLQQVCVTLAQRFLPMCVHTVDIHHDNGCWETSHFFQAGQLDFCAESMSPNPFKYAQQSLIIQRNLYFFFLKTFCSNICCLEFGKRMSLGKFSIKGHLFELKTQQKLV